MDPVTTSLATVENAIKLLRFTIAHIEDWNKAVPEAVALTVACDRFHASIAELINKPDLPIHKIIDRLVIMDSSSINDRSLCGDRNSEIAIVIEDNNEIQSRINGKNYKVTRFATQLRRQLWKEHLGLLQHDDINKVTDNMLPLPTPQLDTLESEEDPLVQDPLDPNTFEIWTSTARRNTEIFRDIFHPVPEDCVQRWEEYHAYYPDPANNIHGHVAYPDMPVEMILEMLDKVHGHLVEFPLDFLSEVDLEVESVPYLSHDKKDLF